MSRPFARRFSIEPCLAHHTISDLARTIGIDRAQVQRWKRVGLTPPAADRVAIALGHHPFELWPDWYDEPAVAS